jgi:hypothetical protein
MRLRDLDAFWLTDATPNGHRRSDAPDGAQGVMFMCPACQNHYILIYFSNPINAPIATAECDQNPRWLRNGDTLDTLTLSPSINLDTANLPADYTGCRWHGFVKNGDAA